MSDLSLRQYLKKVESLLEEGHLEEGKAHARHILSYYPKNREAYLLLGRILIGQRRWEEAAEVLRRLLGADPLNATAHQLLSQAYAQMFQLDNALFHLERAFDQTPNDRQIIAGLRELYSRSRGQKVEKIQLTAGAVAGQYLSNNLPEQAIDILRKARQRFPERVDLKLMLALSYQAAEMHIEAAEAAVDVLKNLPFALQANRIVAEFWLAQQRPSDARLNIARIEEVDPYYAQQIVTGTIDETRYTLPELDYKRLAERELATSDPDWIETLARGGTATTSSADAFGDDLAWLMDDMSQQMAAPSDPTLTTIFEEPSGSLPAASTPAADALADTGGLRPEVIKRLETLKHASNHGTVISSATPPAEPAPPDLSTLEVIDLSSEWQNAPAQPDAELRQPTGLTGLLTSLSADGEDETWMHEVLSGGGPTEPVATQTPDNLDFLTDIGLQPPISPQSGRVSTGFTDLIATVEPPPSSPTDSDESLEDFFSQLETAEDPLDLPYQSGSFFDQLEYKDDVETGFSSQIVSALDADKVSDFDLPSTQYVQPSARTDFFNQLDYYASDEDSALITPNTVSELRSEIVDDLDAESDPLAWMRTSEIEYDENAVNPFDAAAALDESGLMAPTEVPQDPLQWARQHEDVEVEPDPDDDPLAWMRSMGIEEITAEPQAGIQLDDELPVERAQDGEIDSYLETAAEGQPIMTNESNWQDDDLDDFDWLSDESNTSADDQPLVQSDLDWLSEPDQPTPAETSTGFTSMLDRLDPTSQAADDLSWIDKFNTNYLAGDEAPSGEMPREFFDFDDASGDVFDQADNFGFETGELASSFEATDSEGTDWLNQISDDLADVASFDEEPMAASEFDRSDEPLMAGDEFNFMAEEEPSTDEFGFDEGELEAFGLPDAELSEEPLVVNEYGFNTEAGADEFGFDEGELEAFGLPDAELSDEPLVVNEYGFNTEAGADEFGFDEGEQMEYPVATNDFDFTAGTDLISDDLDEVLQSEQEATGFGFSTEELNLFDEEAQPLDAYANELNPDNYADALDDEAERIDWFSEAQPIMSAENEPSWIGAIKSGSEPSAADFNLEEETFALEEDFELDEAFMLNEADLAVTRQPVEIESEMLDEAFALESAESDNIAANAPDWLNSMVPGLDVDYENLPSEDLIEEEFVIDEAYRSRSMEGFDAVNEGYDWLDDLVEEETSNTSAVSVPPPVPLPPVPDFSRRAEPQPAPAAVVPPAATRSFVFAAPPPWLERLRAMLGTASAARDEFDDFDFDDEDLK